MSYQGSSSPVKPSAPHIDHVKNDDIGSSNNTTPFHTANQSPSLYPTLSDASSDRRTSDRTSDSRKRRSTSISNSESKKAYVVSSPTEVQQSSKSWFSQFLHK